MALDTTLMSLCMDSEEHNGTALFAPHSLVETLNTFVERQEAAEAERDFKRHGRFEDQSQSDRDSSDDRSDDDSWKNVFHAMLIFLATSFDLMLAGNRL